MRSASSESESNLHSTIDCQSARGLNKRWHFNHILQGRTQRNAKIKRFLQDLSDKTGKIFKIGQSIENSSALFVGIIGTVIGTVIAYILLRSFGV